MFSTLYNIIVLIRHKQACSAENRTIISDRRSLKRRYVFRANTSKSNTHDVIFYYVHNIAVITTVWRIKDQRVVRNSTLHGSSFLLVALYLYACKYARVCVCICACVCDILLCYKLFPVGVKITTVAFGSIQHLSVSVSICATTSSPAVSILFFTINYNGTYLLRYY